MNSGEDVVVDTAALPRFDLSFGLDDPEDPTAVTVFDPAAPDSSTAWLTMDAAHAVPLEDVA